MRQFGTIVGVLRCIVDRIREYFSMRNAVTPQLVPHYRSGISAVLLKQTLEKTLSCFAVSACL